jgi:aspartate kinase
MPFARVMKFGGAALCDGPAIQRACQIIQTRGGARPLVVVSAHQGVTDMLDTIARSAAEGHVEGDRVRIRHRSILHQLGLEPDLLDRYFIELYAVLEEVRRRGRLAPGELDHILAMGERMSARVVAHALKAAGLRATPVDAYDVGLVTDSNHGDARPLPGQGDKIRAALEQVAGIPVVTGFLARDARGNLTTMGRNGSDLTAALLAEAVGAAELQLWKTVSGMMTADPDLVPEARTVERLGLAEAAEYAFHGAEVVYGAALAPVQRANVSVRILDARTPSDAGTVLEAASRPVGAVGLAARRRLLRLEVAIGPLEPRGACLADLFALMARHQIEPGLVSTAGDRAVVHVAPCLGLEALVAALGRRARVERDISLVAVVGRDLGADGVLAARAMAALANAGVAVHEACVGARVSSQAFVVAEAQLERAARALHAELFPAPAARPPASTPVPLASTARA